MIFQYAFFSLLFYTAVREVFFQYQVNKLLNKAMSRSYYDYKVADTVKPAEPRLPVVDDSPDEDFSHILG